jgi:hypothetical protein
LKLFIPTVIIHGQDIFGRNARIKFSACEKPGWYWRCGNEVVPITSDLASYQSRRITLRYKTCVLEIYEHIGALRWTGLDGIIVESPKFPPYFGRVAEIWNTLRPCCKETGDKLSWVRPRETCFHSEGDRCVYISPNGLDELIMSIFLDIKGIGLDATTYKMPGPLDDIFEARALGRPDYFYHISKFLRFWGWPHHESATWKQELSPEELLQKISLHRTTDLLGALSLVTHDQLVSGEVVSIKGGHQIDIGMIKKLQL